MSLRIEQSHPGVLVATIDRPDKGNSLDTPLMREIGDLASALQDGAHPSVRAVIFTGAGSRAFSAGADISTLRGLTSDQARRQMLNGQDVFDRIEELPQVTIAAINGVALGGGLELALACDLRVAAPHARLGLPEITLANLPGWGGTQRLPRVIGKGRATEMILTGSAIDADTAARFGLVNEIHAEPLQAAIDLALRISVHAPGAIAAAKDAIRYGERHGIQHGLRHEAELVGERSVTPEQRAAVDNFLNRKRTTDPKEAKQ